MPVGNATDPAVELTVEAHTDEKIWQEITFNYFLLYLPNTRFYFTMWNKPTIHSLYMFPFSLKYI